MLHVPERNLRRHCSARRAAATAELAILLPFLGLLFVGASDYSRIFYYSITVENCARNGALYGCANQTQANDTSGIQTVGKKDATDMGSSNLSITSSTDSSTAPTYVDVKASYTFVTLITYPFIPSSVTLQRTVRMRVVPLKPTFG